MMNTRPFPARAGSSRPSIRYDGRKGLARLAGLFVQATVLSLLLLYAAACNEPVRIPKAHAIDSSDTRTRNVIELAHQIDSLSRFVAIMEQVGIAEDLKGYGPWTVFAPVDRAFGRAVARLDTIRRGGLTDSLRMILQYHVVRGRVDTSEVSRSFGDSLSMATVADKPVTMYLREGGILTIGNDQLRGRLLGMVEAQNGILYILNEVLMLPKPDTTLQTELLFF